MTALVNVGGEETSVVATLHADANVCLCVDSSLSTGMSIFQKAEQIVKYSTHRNCVDIGILPDTFLPTATLDLIIAAGGLSNAYLTAALDAIGNNLQVQLSPTSVRPPLPVEPGGYCVMFFIRIRIHRVPVPKMLCQPV